MNNSVNNTYAEDLDSGQLTWADATAAQLAFMKRVYDINLARSASGGTFIADVPSNELSVVEGNFRARINAAQDCRNLLVAVRAAIIAQSKVVVTGLTSAYRSASHQYQLWQSYFNDYYTRTQAHRLTLDGGEHAEAAAQYLASFIRTKIATPGFSNHNNGLAVDFLNIENNNPVNNRTQEPHLTNWHNSWLWQWLTTNAASFNYFQNTAINEPWHWEHRLINESAVVENFAESVIQNIFYQDIFESTGEDEAFRELQLKEVKFLALEGGGGKGVVYLGAVKALQDLKILHFIIKDGLSRLDPNGQVKGIAGSSAGAITAFLLSIGYDAKLLKEFMDADFNQFFDLAFMQRKIPGLTGCSETPRDFIVKKLAEIVSSIPGVGRFLPEDKVRSAIETVLTKFKRDADVNEGPLKKLGTNPFLYFDNLLEDYGIFSGCRMLDVLNTALVRQGGIPGMTFEQHFNTFGIKLIITGTNLRTREVEYFSKDTTPHMTITGAVRISMSLPFIYKPVIISPATASTILRNEKLAGVWVDGGFKDNIPMRAFEHETTIPQPHTLGIRLSRDGDESITNFFQYMAAVCNTATNSEAQISATSGLSRQAIVLDTGSIRTTDFKVVPSIAGPLTARAEAMVKKYFSRPPAEVIPAFENINITEASSRKFSLVPRYNYTMLDLIDSVFGTGMMNETDWVNHYNNRASDIDHYLSMCEEIARIAKADQLISFPLITKQYINTAITNYNSGSTDIKPGLNITTNKGYSYNAETGLVDHQGKYLGAAIPVSKTDPLPEIAIIFGVDTFKSSKVITFSTVRHELMHAAIDEMILGLLEKWRNDSSFAVAGVTDERQLFQKWLAAEKGKKTISALDYELTIHRITTGHSTKVELLTYLEGFMNAFHMIPVADYTYDHAILKKLRDASISGNYPASWPAAGTSVQDEFLGRLQYYYCTYLTDEYRNAFDSIIAEMMNIMQGTDKRLQDPANTAYQDIENLRLTLVQQCSDFITNLQLVKNDRCPGYL